MQIQFITVVLLSIIVIYPLLWHLWGMGRYAAKALSKDLIAAGA